MDIYAEVTNRIILQLEQGQIPWSKPWISSGSAISRATGKPYSLLNQMILGKPGEYLTFAQCQKEGGKVKRGEKTSMVCHSLRCDTYSVHQSVGQSFHFSNVGFFFYGGVQLVREIARHAIPTKL